MKYFWKEISCFCPLFLLFLTFFLPTYSKLHEVSCIVNFYKENTFWSIVKTFKLKGKTFISRYLFFSALKLNFVWRFSRLQSSGFQNRNPLVSVVWRFRDNRNSLELLCIKADFWESLFKLSGPSNHNSAWVSTSVDQLLTLKSNSVLKLEAAPEVRSSNEDLCLISSFISISSVKPHSNSNKMDSWNLITARTNILIWDWNTEFYFWEHTTFKFHWCVFQITT